MSHDKMSFRTVASLSLEGYQFGMNARSRLGFAGITAMLILAQPAQAAVGDWVEADVIQMRLIASTDETGRPVAAVEFRLEPGWKTYWRTPGEGGLPTLFDFSASLNLATATPAYPAPRRYDDGYSITNVYEGRVLFPIEVEPALATVPVTLAVRIDMGVCEVICIPLSLEASLAVPLDERDEVALTLIDEARGLLPGTAEPGTFEVVDIEVTRAENGEALATVKAIVPQAFGADLFVEAPIGWYQSAAHQTARDGNNLTFEVELWRLGDEGALAGEPLTFTLVSGGRAIEQTITLP